MSILPTPESELLESLPAAAVEPAAAELLPLDATALEVAALLPLCWTER